VGRDSPAGCDGLRHDARISWLVYVGLSVWGWYWWLRGGNQPGRLPVSRTPRGEAWLLTGIGVVGSGSASATATIAHHRPSVPTTPMAAPAVPAPAGSRPAVAP
jgi:hypothetical protein